ncbi:MAG: 1-deoxy-D-xylulose-5-phosphate reductoisomerase [Hyphomicrobiaceae bacterium]|nr:1-deoxy-D-xylulose-5-phosphate reductoisomerase [Hyphomicrobiaceae bacterium]
MPTPEAAEVKRISVLGATGSVGQSTLDLLKRNPDRFKVAALTANRDVEALAREAIALGAELAVVADAGGYGALKELLAGSGVRAGAGPAAILEAAQRPADCVVAGIAGAAGLAPTLAAVAQGRRVALANKECLVSAGGPFMEAVRAAGTELLPIDSEHSAVFQALAGVEPDAIETITLTASGGPFRGYDDARLKAATPEAALRHPNWSMGRKISVDSATLMNKGLELIEAYYLFPVRPEQLAVIVHPQSIVHALVAFRDGSVLAQLACPDMRTPIALGLSWPARMDTPTKRLDLVALASLTFEAPDEARFRCLALARQALAEGGLAPALLNAANEIAVEAFLQHRIGFLQIAELVEDTMELAGRAHAPAARVDLAAVLDADAVGRRIAMEILASNRLGKVSVGVGARLA